MNDQQRAAMQMALEALESWKQCCEPKDWPDDDEQAITALREALAQPQYQWVDLTDDEMQDCHCLNGTAYPFALAIIAKFKEKNTPPAVLQEPVVWRVWRNDTRQWSYKSHAVEGLRSEPLYTTPPVVPQGDDDLTIAYMVGYEKGKDYMKEKAACLREQIALQGVQSSWYEDGFWDGLVAYEQAIRSMK